MELNEIKIQAAALKAAQEQWRRARLDRYNEHRRHRQQEDKKTRAEL